MCNVFIHIYTLLKAFLYFYQDISWLVTHIVQTTLVNIMLCGDVQVTNENYYGLLKATLTNYTLP